MQNHMKNPVQTNDHLRPRVSARNVIKIAQEDILTMPYTPVAKRLLLFPVTPKSVSRQQRRTIRLKLDLLVKMVGA